MTADAAPLLPCPDSTREGFPVTSADGTRLQAWRGSGPVDGVPVMLSPGLGAPPEVFEWLWAPGSPYRALSWSHRGMLGSAMPSDRRRRHVADHVDDLRAVMDAAGVERAVLVGWSIGVNVAAEFAVTHPDRVAGLLAVAGLPGGTFATMGATLGIPAPLRHPVALTGATLGRAAGPVLDLAAGSLLHRGWAAGVVRRSGFVLPGASSAALGPVLTRFGTNHYGWYFAMAQSAARHAPVDPAALTVPVTLLAGRFDVLAHAAAMRKIADVLPDGRYVRVPTSHFLPLERTDLVVDELAALVARTDLG